MPELIWAFCHESELVGNWPFRIIPTATHSQTIKIQWFGHSAFLLTSSRGTKVLMDPHGRGIAQEEIFPHVVTTSHLHRNHSFIWMAKGNPLVLHGLNPRTEDWNRIHRTVRDVSIYTVPTYHDSEMGLARGKNAVFVVAMDGICIAHLGDLGHLLNEAQIKMMGKIDVLLVPLGQGGYRITSEDAAKVVAQVKPRVAIPYHYRWEGFADEFAKGFSRVRKINENFAQFSKDTLTHEMEIIVLKDPIEYQ
ncbi:MAG: MBL fold metallo-hydrolase [Candidatus Binatia bacterium]